MTRLVAGRTAGWALALQLLGGCASDAPARDGMGGGAGAGGRGTMGGGGTTATASTSTTATTTPTATATATTTGTASGGAAGAGGGVGGSGIGGNGGSREANDSGTQDAEGSDAALEATGSACASGGSGFDTSVDGVALDRKTCLAWERLDPDKPMASCVIARDSNAKLCWSEAGRYCQALRLEGQSDWRLPTRAELRTILLADVGLCPRADSSVFTQALKSIYWTSEPIGTDHAWGIDFCDGMDHSAGVDGPQAVRCVRAAPR